MQRGPGRFTFAAVQAVHLPTTARAREMATYYYGTIPVLAWILNHYFYGGVHYAWLAKEFLPPKPNPSSSNPHHIYGEFKDAWNDGDPWNSTVLTARTGMLRGVKAKRDAGVVKRWTATRLRIICQHVSVDLFYPIVYRVDVERISPDRLVVANSGLRGSREVLIHDLRETEFELLFADNTTDTSFTLLVLDEMSGARVTSPAAVLTLLKARCAP